MSTPPWWTCIRLSYSSLDFVTDVIQSIAFFSGGHLFWGSLTLLFPVLSYLVSFLLVLAKRRRGDSCCELIIATLKSSAGIVGMLEAGPELVLQSAILLHGGQHVEDIERLTSLNEVGSWPYLRGAYHLFSICFSFISVLVTLLIYNDAGLGGCCCRWLMSATTHISCVIVRIVLASVLFAVAPLKVALPVSAVIYICNVMSVKTLGLSLRDSLLPAFASLFAPSGFVGNRPMFSRMLEMRRAGEWMAEETEEMEMDRGWLVRNARISHFFFQLLSVFLLISTALVVALHYEGGKEVVDVVRREVNPGLFYGIPAVFQVFSIVCSMVFISGINRGCC